MKKQWDILPEPPDSFYQQHPELPTVVARLLYHRGITDAAAIDEFLNPDYTKDVHDPFLFRDMAKSVDRILAAIDADEKIIVHGDYDADGVCASTILVSTIRNLGSNQCDVFLPHRETDGYGLNTKNVQMLADDRVNLIISCDCGVSNVEEVELANKLGVDVIITDHHAIPPTLPPAHSIIHPKIEGEPYPDKGLAGGGVAFKLAQGLLRTHESLGKELADGQTHAGFEKWLLGMVAIASVADMVPLLGESRTLTKYGLIVLNKTKRIGLQKLLLEARLMQENGSMKKTINATTIGFQIAPRINAAGRMNHANVAYNLMMTEDPIEATNLAAELNENNKSRQQLVEKIFKEAMKQVEQQEDSPILFVQGEGWLTGVVGLIAGKLKERYYKPTLAMAVNDGVVTGSGRSIAGFNMIEALQTIPEHFDKYGGHPMACGFTLKSIDGVGAFKKSLVDVFHQKTEGIDLSPRLQIDAEANLESVDWQLYDILQKFEPFGKDNEQPLYMAKGVTIETVRPIGKKKSHISLMVKHKSPKLKKMVGWNFCSETNGKMNWCRQLKKGDIIDVVFEIGVNEWNGNRELQLTIKDLRMSQ